jgi:hypothetical protein
MQNLRFFVVLSFGPYRTAAEPGYGLGACAFVCHVLIVGGLPNIGGVKLAQ